MSAFGPKRTSQIAPHMSAFGGKADMARFYSTFGKSGTQYEIASNTSTDKYQPKNKTEFLCGRKVGHGSLNNSPRTSTGDTLNKLS